jgi:hypothetical protein
MGGRLYSLPLHRFISADPNVQFPLSSQGYNRYAYVNNNPLSETDPTGYFAGGLLGTAEQLDITRSIRWWLFRQMGPQMAAAVITVGSSYCGSYAALCAMGGTFDYAQAVGASTNASLRAAAAAAVMAYATKLANGMADEGNYGEATATAYAGGYTSSRIAGGEGALGGRLAMLQVWLRVAMDEYSGYQSTTDRATKGAVVKAKGTAVQDPDASNTGVAIVIPSDAPGAHELINKPLNELTQSDLGTLAQYNIGIDRVNGQWTLGWETEGGAFMQGVGEDVPIGNSFSVFHDVWMDKWGVNGNSFFGSIFLKASIPVAIYGQCAALGCWSQEHILSISEGQQ